MKNMKKTSRALQAILFKHSALNFIVIGILFFVVTKVVIIGQLQDNAYQALDDMIDTQASIIDGNIDIMDSYAMQAVSAYNIKDYLAYRNGTDTSYQEKEVILQQLSVIVSPAFAVSEMQVYDLEGNYLNSRGEYGTNSEATTEEWYQGTMEQKGRIYMSEPYKYENGIYCSLYRLTFNMQNSPIGMVEVRQNIHKLFRELKTIRNQGTYSEVIVFNEKNEIIYPTESLEVFQGLEYSDLVQEEHKIESENNLYELSYDGSNYLVGEADIKDTSWKLVLVSNEKNVLQSVQGYDRILLSIVAVGMFLAIFIPLIEARIIIAPIAMLQDKIKRMSIDKTYKTEKETICGIREIDELNKEYDKMNDQLGQAIHSHMLLQQQELQYQMLALQSQMNPHFLYNFLSNISSMAEENKSEQITYFCKQLSFMLRYISVGDASSVTLFAEVDYTKKYLECMQLRFEDDLTWDIHIPEEMMEIKIPRLSIQPLVENSIKFCGKRMPPWNISVRGYLNVDKWYVVVEDNGPGMTEEEIDNFWMRVRKIESERKFPELELRGMGLLNVYIRLNGIYKNNTIFEITRKNEEEGLTGTVVKIGGYIQT